MSQDGTHIRVVISAESNKKLQSIQARLLQQGKPAGKREAIERAVEVCFDNLSIVGIAIKPKPRKR